MVLKVREDGCLEANTTLTEYGKVQFMPRYKRRATSINASLHVSSVFYFAPCEEDLQTQDTSYSRYCRVIHLFT